TRADLDLYALESIPAKLAAQEFDVLLNPAGMTSPDACEEQPDLAHRVNTAAPQALARACHLKNARFIHFSTDYVFDGESQTEWSEDDPTAPVNVYGQSKADGERAVLSECPDALVARVSWLFGPDKPSHPDQIIAKASQTDTLSAVADKTSAPTFTHDLCGWIEAIVTHHPAARGTLHLCNSGSASWHGWAQAALEIAASLGVPVRTTQVTPAELSSLTFFKAARPPHTTMRVDKLNRIAGITPRHWRVALVDYLTQKHAPA
ncbi:MAG: sugar nucleotide-binding protein, partial [Verrucomicrobiaceae bacterium]|nr:sugar nucleotide-binding protein [Verrucomicrobiaceae bacterium]